MSTHRLIIDTTTASKDELIKRLLGEPFVLDCRDGGVYQEDPMLAKIEVDSELDEFAIDHWMYTQKGVDCFGVTSL